MKITLEVDESTLRVSLSKKRKEPLLEVTSTLISDVLYEAGITCTVVRLEWPEKK